MKIGVFDSGIGGLFILKALRRALPAYDFVYLGDTKRVPYGNRSQPTIFEFTRDAVDYLFRKNCGLIILACNTASSKALRKIQREYLPTHYPKRRVLGVVIPTVEEVAEDRSVEKVGVLGTLGTISSGAFAKELKKLKSKQQVFQQAAPLLVPLVESGEMQFSRPILEYYLKAFLKERVDAVLLGCTHYPALKKQIQALCTRRVKVISQDELLAKKLKDYLRRHPEIDKTLSKKSQLELLVTDKTPETEKLARKWFGKKTSLKLVKLKIFHGSKKY